MNTKGEMLNWDEKIKQCRYLDVHELMVLLKMDIVVFMSWGANGFLVDRGKNTRMFRMSVNGYLHKGYVYIFLNGLDLFDVYLTTKRDIIVDNVEGLYFDELVEWIDSHIETA